MPIALDIPINLGMEDILRREGVGGQNELRVQISNLLEETFQEARSYGLLESRVAYEYYDIDAMSDCALKLENGIEIVGELLPKLFPEAVGLIALICTIGPALENRSSEYFKQGEQTRGLLLDGIGSAAIDVLSIESCHRVVDFYSAPGKKAGSPVSPGMPGLPLSEQAKLIKLVDAEAIGVSLTRGGMLEPRKSASMLLCVGENMEQWTPAEVCAKCFLRKNCPYRIRKKKGASEDDDGQRETISG